MGSILALPAERSTTRKNNQREKNPAPDAGLIAGGGWESRQTGQKMAQKCGF
jgi:hypothetical protein